MRNRDIEGDTLFTVEFARFGGNARLARIVVLETVLDSPAPECRLVGEGFDHPPLDTLILAMPVSWKGTLQQYAGRLHREHASKTDVRIIDFVDTGHPALIRMWDKRQRGYRAMGYRVGSEDSTGSLDA